MIRVYIAEDSVTVQHILTRMLEGERDILVVGAAMDGVKAQADLAVLKPDLLITDLWMPGQDGYALIEWVMRNQPIPVLVLTDAVDVEGQETVVRCLALGALEVLSKSHMPSRDGLLRLIRTLSGVRPIRLRGRVPGASALPVPLPDFGRAVQRQPPELVVFGASTGGPQVLQAVLSSLPAAFPLPILLAVHIENGFMGGLVRWLGTITPLEVRMDAEGERPRPGCVYFPREAHHLTLDPQGCLRALVPESGEVLVPSVDRLFHSVALARPGRAVACLFTGMGRDGASGMLALRRGGSLTLAQDEDSCVVYGMPKAAMENGGAERSLTPVQMVAELLHLAQDQNKRNA